VFGLVVGMTPTLGPKRLGWSSSSSRVLFDALAQVSFRLNACWSVQLGAGVAIQVPLGGSTEGIASNTNVEPFTTVSGGVVALSATLLGEERDYTFDLRAAYLTSEYMREIPIVLSTSLQWGRER
jgi:hypothetical protein